MYASSLLPLVLVAAVLALVILRQLSWRFFKEGEFWRGPVILAIVGVGLLVTVDPAPFTVPDIALAAVEVVLAVGAGFLAGRVARIRAVDAAHSEKGRAGIQVSGGWFGVVIYLAFIVVRVGSSFALAAIDGHSIGQGGMPHTGLFLVLLGVMRGVTLAVVNSRIQRGARPVPVAR